MVCSAGFILNCLARPDIETWEKYMQERKRSLELEGLLIGTLRFGCDRMEDYHDKRDAGLSLKALARPNIEARKSREAEQCAKRYREGRQTEQDLKAKERWEARRRQQEEWERETEEIRKEREAVAARLDRATRILRQTLGLPEQ
jgi:hypothetical protein